MLTLWMLSSDNVKKRPQEELDIVYATYIHFCTVKQPICIKHKIKIIVSGDMTSINQTLAESLKQLVKQTEHNNQHVLNLAINYSGHQDSLELIKKMLRHNPDPTAITSEFVEQFVAQNRPFPKQDLIIRTGNAQRLSGFTNWLSDTSELYFTPILFPDFTMHDFFDALSFFSQQQRRFGK